VLSHRSLHHPIQATGHGDLVQAPDGSWWLVCLGIRPVDYPNATHLGRETFLAPVRWDDQGWPEIGHAGRVELEMDDPTPPAQPWPAEPVRDDFDSLTLAPAWNFLRNPRTQDFSLSARPGWLGLVCAPTSLDEVGSPAWLGRRQQAFECRAATLIDFEPGGENEEAGLVVWMNERHHYEVFVTQRAPGRRLAVVRRRIGSLQAEVARVELPPGPLELALSADARTYRFSLALPGEASRVLAQAETRYLATEVAGGFTGVYIALYASASGRDSARAAWFDWFELS
jgi:alpha-N-arabinofuranosidase